MYVLLHLNMHVWVSKDDSIILEQQARTLLEVPNTEGKCLAGIGACLLERQG